MASGAGMGIAEGVATWAAGRLRRPKQASQLDQVKKLSDVMNLIGSLQRPITARQKALADLQSAELLQNQRRESIRNIQSQIDTRAAVQREKEERALADAEREAYKVAQQRKQQGFFGLAADILADSGVAKKAEQKIKTQRELEVLAGGGMGMVTGKALPSGQREQLSEMERDLVEAVKLKRDTDWQSVLPMVRRGVITPQKAIEIVNKAKADKGKAEASVLAKEYATAISRGFTGTVDEFVKGGKEIPKPPQKPAKQPAPTKEQRSAALTAPVKPTDALKAVPTAFTGVTSGRQIGARPAAVDGLMAAFTEMQQSGIAPLRVISGFRPTNESIRKAFAEKGMGAFVLGQTQEQLWNTLSKTGRPVAKPGNSDHERGIAFDFAAEPTPEQAAILARHGIVKTVGNDMNHFVYVGQGGAGVGAGGRASTALKPKAETVTERNARNAIIRMRRALNGETSGNVAESMWRFPISGNKAPPNAPGAEKVWRVGGKWLTRAEMASDYAELAAKWPEISGKVERDFPSKGATRKKPAETQSDKTQAQLRELKL